MKLGINPSLKKKPVQEINEIKTYLKCSFWKKTCRGVSEVPGAIKRVFVRTCSVPRELFHRFFKNKVISERAVSPLKEPTKLINDRRQLDLSLSPKQQRSVNPIEKESGKGKDPEQTRYRQSNNIPNNERNFFLNAVNPEHHQSVMNSTKENSDKEFEVDDMELVPLISDTDDEYDDTFLMTPTSQVKEPELSSDKVYHNIGRWREVNEKQLDRLVYQLTMRRLQVQKYIRDTQVAFLRYGPSSESTLQQLNLLEENTMAFTRGLIYYNKKARKHPELTRIKESLEADFVGLKAFISDAKKYDFRSGHQYLKQVFTYRDLAYRILAREEKSPAESLKIRQQIDKVINDKLNIGLVDGVPVECVSGNIDELLALDSKLRKIFQNKKVFNDEMIKLLSENSKPIHSQFHVYFNGKWKKISTTYTPAAAMRFPALSGNGSPGNRSPFEKPYNGMFCSSMERSTKHAMNMMGYTMKIDGRPATSQIRVGCPYAYTEKNEKLREKVTLDRIKEIFTALLVQNHSGELQEAIKNPRHTPINLTAVYFNLLSPDNIRHNGIMRSIGASDEKEWVKRIHKALKNLSGKEMTLKVFMDNGEQANVRINPNVHMFVIPSNQLALQQQSNSNLKKRILNKIIRNIAKSWKTVNHINNDSLKWLIGKDGPAHQLDQFEDEVCELFDIRKGDSRKEKLRLLINTGKLNFEKVAKEKHPFIFSEMLFQTLEELNVDIFSGCKSNKDRTSIFQSVLQSQAITGMSLHERSRKNDVTAQPRDMVAELCMVYGGHTEIQKRNVVLAGYLTDDTLGACLDPISYKLMMRKMSAGERRKAGKSFISTNADAFTPITLE